MSDRDAAESSRGYLIVNPRSGDDSPSAEELVEAAEEQGVRCHVLRDGDDCEALARGAAADALGKILPGWRVVRWDEGSRGN